MRPASTVVFPLPGPARTLSGPSPAVTTSRWLGEKSLRSTPRSERWQLLGPTTVACQLLPSEQVAAVDQVQHVIARAFSNNADNECVLILAIAMAGEEVEGIGRVAHDAQHRMDGDLRKNILGRQVANDSCRSAAPEIEVELLDSGQTPGGLTALPLVSRIRFWCGGHECSLACMQARGWVRRCVLRRTTTFLSLGDVVRPSCPVARLHGRAGNHTSSWGCARPESKVPVPVPKDRWSGYVRCD